MDALSLKLLFFLLIFIYKATQLLPRGSRKDTQMECGPQSISQDLCVHGCDNRVIAHLNAHQKW